MAETELTVTECNNRCINETGVSRSIVELPLTTDVMPLDDKYKDFLLCVFKLRGFVNGDNGRIYHDLIARDMSEHDAKSEEIVHLIAGCKNSTPMTDVRELRDAVYTNVKCMFDKHRDVETIRRRNEAKTYADPED